MVEGGCMCVWGAEAEPIIALLALEGHLLPKKRCASQKNKSLFGEGIRFLY